MRDAEVEGGVLTGGGDPYAPYATSPALEGEAPWGGAGLYGGGVTDPFAGGSSQALPLVSHQSPFQRADMYEADDAGYDERGSLRRGGDSEFDAHSRFTSAVDERETASNFGSESYAPSRNMFGAEGKGAGAGAALLDKDALAGEIQEGETAEVLKESSARRRWVTLCWILTFWVPNPLLSWCGRMKRIDVRQAWREKLALNILIWFVCLCTAFVIVFLGRLICPTEVSPFLFALLIQQKTDVPHSTYSASLSWRRITSSSAQVTSTRASMGRCSTSIPSRVCMSASSVSSPRRQS